MVTRVFVPEKLLNFEDVFTMLWTEIIFGIEIIIINLPSGDF